MINLNRESVIDVDAYVSALNHMGYITFNRDMMNQQYQRCLVEEHTWYDYLTRYMASTSSRRYRTLKSDSVIDYLQRVHLVPERFFLIRNSSNQIIKSIDKTKVMSKISGNNFAPEFFEYYYTHNRLKSTNNSIGSLLNDCRTSVGEDKDGNILYAIPCTAFPAINLRFNYRDKAVISIPKEYVSSFVAEKDYFFVSGDFEQSDPRIFASLLLFEDEDIIRFQNSVDMYRSIAQLMYERDGSVLTDEEFKPQRPKYKLHAISSLYGKKVTGIKEDDEFIAKLHKFYETKSKFREFKRRVAKRFRLKKRISIESYFGGYEDLEYTSDEDSFTNTAFATVGQRGTSEIIIMTVNHILTKFRELGYNEDKVCMFMVRHDEPIFRVHKDVLKDLWVFKDCSMINVPGFIPLFMKFSMGYSYKVEDVGLMDEYDACCKVNSDKINLDYHYDYNSGIKDFYPVKDVAEVVLGHTYITEIDKTVCMLYNPSNKKSTMYLVESTEDADLYNYVKGVLDENSDNIIETDKRDIIVTSQFTFNEDGADMIGFDHFVRFEQHTTELVNSCIAASTYYAILYCKKNEIKHSLTPPAQIYEDFLNSLQNVDSKELFVEL